MLTVANAGFIQRSGILVVKNYGPSLYRRPGFGLVKQLLFPALWLTSALVFCFISIAIVNLFPRPKFIGFGLMGCMVCLSDEAAFVPQFIPSDSTAAPEAAVAMLIIFAALYEICLNGPQFIYFGEIFPSPLRAKGVCLGAAMLLS